MSRQIDEMQDALAQLMMKRSQYRTICSPIRRMPMELLGRIFGMSLDMPLDKLGRNDLISLSLVCRSWRSASLSARSLWSGVVITSCECFDFGFHEIDHMHDEEYEDVIAWFDRAGGSAKTLEYRLSTTTCRCFKGDRCTINHPTVKRLIQDGPPLYRFSIQVSSVGCLKNWSIFAGSTSAHVLTQSAWTSLHSFSLAFLDNEDHLWDDGDDSRPSVFNLLPNFSSFDLRLPTRDKAFDDREDSLDATIRIPDRILGSIGEFSIVWDWGGNQLLHILPRCASLTRLSIDLTKSKPFDNPQSTFLPYPSPQSFITLPNLREFVLSKGDFSILEVIRTPLLEIMDVEAHGASVGSQAELGMLRTFIIKSSLSGILRSLSIRGLVGESGVVDLSLPILSSLQVLVLDSPHVSSYRFGDPVEVSAEGQSYFKHPSLVELKLMNIRRSRNTLVSELWFLKNRRRSNVSCMISVSFHDEPRCSETELKGRASEASPGHIFVNIYPSPVI
ncbi:hypothetical protein DFP72DRAFT_1081873 [Ephemerocybe angulata]|uniref:F-box domain-containing protein n=1 Tax=Ephemerocybe angulata TaxID=980116 RepID=A0A8H6H8N7_9AGAR|nr:hypothetical protein DFP72DRAFT_1081873 [Tulosesus angulatus]